MFVVCLFKPNIFILGQLFETELKQNENKVQELKDRVTELLEKNPDAPEAPKWKQMLNKIGMASRKLITDFLGLFPQNLHG